MARRALSSWECRRARSGGFELSGGLLVAERADESARVGAVQHDGRGLAVAERAEADERGRSGAADVGAMLMGVEDEGGAELRGERGEGAARLCALLERARVVAEEQVDLVAAGEALKGGPLACGGPVPVAAGASRATGNAPP